MKNLSSRLEARLARLLSATAPLSAPATTPTARLDLVYLSETDKDRLSSLLQ